MCDEDHRGDDEPHPERDGESVADTREPVADEPGQDGEGKGSDVDHPVGPIASQAAEANEREGQSHDGGRDPGGMPVALKARGGSVGHGEDVMEKTW